MSLYSIIGILSTVTLFLPVILILVFRFYRYGSYLALLAYCSISLFNNLFNEGVIRVSKEFNSQFSIMNNLLDVPLMMTFLLIFSNTKLMRNRMKLGILLFIVFEILVIFSEGLSRSAVTIFLGPGLLMIFLLSLYFFTRKVKQSFVQAKATGKAVMITSICFAYGCFLCIYFMHYILHIDDIPNLFLIYYLVTIIYSCLLTAGLYIESKRLKILGELELTRKELRSFFSDEKNPDTSKKISGKRKFGLN